MLTPSGGVTKVCHRHPTTGLSAPRELEDPKPTRPCPSTRSEIPSSGLDQPGSHRQASPNTGRRPFQRARQSGPDGPDHPRRCRTHLLTAEHSTGMPIGRGLTWRAIRAIGAREGSPTGTNRGWASPDAGRSALPQSRRGIRVHVIDLLARDSHTTRPHVAFANGSNEPSVGVRRVR
jgi:hypothetical protein